MFARSAPMNKKIGIVSASLSLALCLATVDHVRAADLRIGVPNWTSVEMTAHVIKEIAEERLGLSVELVSADNDGIYEAMGVSGGIDLHPEAWLPNHQSYIDRFGGDDGPVILKVGHYNAIQGICVTRDAAVDHGITTIHDLSDERKAVALDQDGDGRGEIWIGADGWLSTPIERARAATYGYANILDLTVMSEQDGIGALGNAVNAGRPYAFFCYGPHHVFQLYELVLLEEPAYEEKRWTMVTPDQADDWLEQSSIDVAWPPTRVHMAYTRKIAETHPALATLIEAMDLNSRQVSAWTYARKVDNVEPDAFAEQWVSENADLVNEWLDGND